MDFDYCELRKLIREKYGTQKIFAANLGICRTSLSHRLNNTLQFSQKEIEESCALLSIPKNEIPTYFFSPKVQKQEQKMLKQGDK